MVPRPHDRVFPSPRSVRLLISIILVLVSLTGAANAYVHICQNPSCWGVPYIFSDEWDGGSDLGVYYDEAECSGPYDARTCIPYYHTLTSTVTIPDTVNLSRVVRARIYIHGRGFDGNCHSGIWTDDDVIYINSRQYTDCPFNVPLPYSDLWDFDVAPADLVTGVNTVTYAASPWRLSPDQYGNTIYGGGTSVTSVNLRLEYITPPAPELYDLLITPDLLITNHDVTITPVITGESPDWEIEGLTYYVIDKESGKVEFQQFIPDTSNLTYRPAGDAYGRKSVHAKLHVQDRMTGQRRLSGEREVPITIYFDKGMYPNWQDDDADNRPNWFEYWRDDGAVPLLDNTVGYSNGTGFGLTRGTYFEIYPLAATYHYSRPIVIPSTALSPTGESFGGPDVVGIDCAAEVVAHENYHKWVNEQWLPGGMFYNQDDTDVWTLPNGTVVKNDRLPDFYEETISYTDYFDITDTYNLAERKAPFYAVYGDQEYMAMRAGDEKLGIVAKDWAYPGKQSGDRRTIPGSNPPMVYSCAGSCDIYSPNLPFGAPAGVTDQPADTDGNTLYNTLTAGNDITIAQEGMYEVVAVLSGSDISGPVTIAIQRNQTAYAVGTYPVTAVFPGTEISSAGINGPYNVTISWRHEFNENDDAPSVTWQTAPYQSTDFEPVNAGFAGAVSAAPSGRDLDAAVPLVVNKAGAYTIEGYLQDPDGVTMAHGATTSTYPPGAVTVHVLFDGNPIASYHRDGTFRLVKFRILDASGTVLGVVGEAGTVDITCADYGTNAPILTDSNSEYISGITEEGKYEGLTICAGVNASSAGEYAYSATLFDAENNPVQTVKGGKIFSSPGGYTIPLNFSGKMIYNCGVSGPFTLRFLEIFGPAGSDSRSTAYTTGSYAFTDFDQPAIVITGNITDTPVDLDSDGLYDILRVGFDVEVGHTGGTGSDFPISANLTGPGGILIAEAGIRPQLEKYQIHNVTLDFPGTSISGMGIDGPYAVTDITAGITYTNTYHDTYDTAAYAASEFEPAAILTGFVFNDTGYPVPGTTISAMGETGYTNIAGLYRIIYGESHQGGVLAMPPAGSGLSSVYEIRTVTPGSTTYCNFTLFDNTGIFGTVTAENGTALTTGLVTTSGPSDKTFNLATWGNGSYRISGIKNGTYTITYIPAVGTELLAAPEKGLVLAPGEIRELNFTAYTPRSLGGTVRDINGEPLEDAEVAITQGPITSTWPYAPETEADGSYAFSELVPGTYTLNVTPPFEQRDTLVENSTSVTIALTDTSVIQDIVMMPAAVAPEAWFPDMNETAGSAPLAVSFTDNSRGYPDSWLWDFGDGGTSTLQNPVHTYTEEGIYDLTLTVSNEFGSDTGVWEDSITVTGSPRLILPSGTLKAGGSGTYPLAADDLQDASILQFVLAYDPAVVRLDGVGNGTSFVGSIDTTIDNDTGSATISIYFSNEKSFTEVTRLADLSFSAPGSAGQETTLLASPADQVACAGGEGCWPGARETLTNLSVSGGSLLLVTDTAPLDIADFKTDIRGGTVPVTIAFDSSTAGIVSPVSWLWDFGDGSTSALQAPTHTYATEGMYDVSLTVTNISGSGTLSRPAYISASPAGAVETYLFVTAWGHEGSGAGGEAEFQYPSGIAMHPSGNLYICDPDNSRVQIVSPDGTYTGAFGSAGTGDGQFGDYFFGIAAGPDGSVYVADVRNNRVQKFSASGSFITAWGTTGSGAGQFQWPSGIATDKDGNVYVTDAHNHRIQKFDSSGTFLTSWGSNGVSDGMFEYPQDVALDSEGMVYVIEGGTNRRVQKFDSGGTFIDKWGGPGSGDGEFLYLDGIAVSADGGVFVTDDEAFRVQKFDREGQYLTRWGSEGSGSGQFDYPNGITTDSSGKVYVVDSSNNRVEVFAPMSAGEMVAGFRADPISGTVPLTVQFIDESTGSPTTWLWDFGDESTSTVQNPSHQYNSPGTYTVSLNASNAESTDTRTRTDYITVNPVSEPGSPPVINSVTPEIATLNSTINVTITGENFQAGAGKTWVNFTFITGGQMFDNRNITLTSVTTSRINVTMIISPDMPAGKWNLTVTTVEGEGVTQAKKNPAITVSRSPVPTITSISPVSGYQNSTVTYTIIGSNFISGQTTVYFVNKTGGLLNNAELTSVTATRINGTIVIPPNAPVGSWNLNVGTIDSGGNGTKTGAFTVSKVLAPTMGALTPSNGARNTTTAFTLTGTNFQTGAGTTAARVYEDVMDTELGVTITDVTATKITGTIIAGAEASPGSYIVEVTTVDGGTVSKAGGFTIIQATIPTISSMTPMSSHQNGTVAYTVTGTGFQPEKTTVVLKNQTTGAVLGTMTADSVTNTKIMGNLTIPVAAPTGNYRLDIMTLDGGVVNRINTFRVDAVRAPGMGSMTPTTGFKNTTVAFTLTGTNFQTGTGQTSVAIVEGTSGTNLAATIYSVTPTRIIGSFTIPAGTPAGKYRLELATTDGGTVTKADAFTVSYLPLPTISSLMPTSGNRGSIVKFTLRGRDFLEGGTVVKLRVPGNTINGVLGSVNSTTIIGDFTIPAGAATGPYRLDIYTVDGGINSKINAFTVK